MIGREEGQGFKASKPPRLLNAGWQTESPGRCTRSSLQRWREGRFERAVEQMRVGVQALGMGWPPQSSTQGEEKGQRTEGSYQSLTKDTPKTHTYSHFIPKAFN